MTIINHFPFRSLIASQKGVESEKCPSFSKALEKGEPVQTFIHPTLADGLAVPMVGYNAFATTVPLLDKMVVVKEEWIALAILRLVEQEKSKTSIFVFMHLESINQSMRSYLVSVVVEGAGAAGLAAILAGHLSEFANKKFV